MLPAQSTPQDGPLEAPDTLDPEALDSFVSSLVRRRDRAIAGRKSCGIESEMMIDEEMMQGVDDANRQFVRNWVASIKRGQPLNQMPEGARSTVFLNVTRMYVEAAAARLADMLLPTDDKCWSIQPTPIAELDPATTAQLDNAGINWAQMQGEVQTQADEAAKRMSEAIEDALAEANWAGEVRMVIEDAARIGWGVLKGPVPMKRVAKKWNLDEMGNSNLQIVSEIKPGSIRIDPWNFFPDPSCGESIHKGIDVWERSYVTSKELGDMRDLPGYDGQRIGEVLKEGPKQLTSREAGDGTYVPILGQYECWTTYCVVRQRDASAFGLDVTDETPMVNCMAVLVNDKLIKITLNPLDDGSYPYDVMTWQRLPGVPYGAGVARHIRTPQRMLNAAGRAMMDNSGLTAAPQIVIGNGVVPADGKFEIRGRKLWRAEPDVTDVRGAFYAWVPESHQAEFERIMQIAREMAEQTTGMPLMLQGQSPEGSAGSKTLGGMQLLNNNASGVLRRLAKRFDDHITEPHIRRYYSWLMQYDQRSDIKGDFEIDARGSSSLVQRDANKQFMFAALNFAANPAFGINSFALFRELAKSDGLDPKLIQYDEEEYKQMQQQGPSLLEKANADLKAAQAERERADTVLRKIEALFSATQTASLIAASPQIAPAADATALSAGFVDANSPPVIGVPPPGAAPAPIQQNTDPRFPANPKPPLEPDQGVMSGIEGGAPQ